MTLACDERASGVDPLAHVESPADFASIAGDDTEGIVWRRSLPDAFRRWMGALSTRALPSARVVLPVQDCRDSVEQIMEAGRLPPGAARDWLVEDVTMLATSFSNALAAPYLRLRFDVIDDDGCTKFHKDAVTARLLCTYRGAGTQYGALHGGEEGTPDPIFTAPTGAVLVLRGRGWPNPARDTVRHRSAPIAQSDATRCVLVLDPVNERPRDDGREGLLA